MKVLELFAGIGGCATALGTDLPTVAVDQDEAAARAYAHLHGHPVLRRNLHHVKPAWFRGFDADFWWMSPPCQPYTIRGHQRDLDDRRAQAFRRVVAAIDALTPAAIGLENVPTFAGSRSEALILEVLRGHHYDVHTEVLCPTALGVPAQRRRYYLTAARDGLQPASQVRWTGGELGACLDPPDPAYAVPAALARKYEGALHIVDADDPDAISVCFTGAYGRSPVHAGSYVRQGGIVRWLTPVEIARTLGFGSTFSLPAGLTREKRYKLVGNSLSVVAVRKVLSRIPGLLGDATAHLPFSEDGI